MQKRRAAIYARFSTDLQSDRSIDDQLALCRQHATAQGFVVSHQYSDRAKTSASLIGRDGISDLMADAKSGHFDTVIVEALDRISRDQEDLAGIFKRLQFLNIDLLAVHDGQADAVQVGIRGLLGTLFLADLKHKVRRGMQGVVRDGRNAGGRAYGYTPVLGKPGELQINPKEAQVVNGIFEAYLNGDTPKSIAARLNSEGVLPPRGAKWNASTINGNKARGYGILVNPLYNGEIIWNRVRMVRDPDTGKRISRTNPESEWHHAPAEHLRIVSSQLFQQVQDRKDHRTKLQLTRQTKRPKRFLSGLIKCGCCGGNLAVHERYKSGTIRLKCSRATESGTCDNRRSVKLNPIESAVVDRISQHIDNPAYIKAYLDAYIDERKRAHNQASSSRPNPNRDRAHINRDLDRANTSYKRLVELFTEGLIDGPEAKSKLVAAKQKIQDLKEEATRTRPLANNLDLKPAALTALKNNLKDLSAAIKACNDAGLSGPVDALRSFLDKIVVTPNETKFDVTISVQIQALTYGGFGGSGGGT